MKTVSFGLSVLVLFCATAKAAGQNPFDRRGVQWSPYLEWTVKNPKSQGNPFDIIATATFTHKQSGETRTTGMFYAGGDSWRFRLTATRAGGWTFTTQSKATKLNGLRGKVRISANPKGSGFVVGVGNKWAQQRGTKGTPVAFIPQFVMYGHPKTFYRAPRQIDRDIKTLLLRHGFTGFHVPVFCRWFDINQDRAAAIKTKDPNPDMRTFEALELLITKVHAAGGCVHLWIWGDEQRTQTPAKWGINGMADRRLQRYMAARLGPLPGWTAGYGFDLWEWVKGPQLRKWHRHMHQQLGWSHMLGARAQKNKLTQIYDGLDYSSFEQHRPTYATYVESISRRPDKPSFSEDRFRIRNSRTYRKKDYNEERTRRGLWHSAMAGGVANIWGNLLRNPRINSGGAASEPYRHPHWIKTNAEFFRPRFLVDMKPDNRLTNGVCLRSKGKPSLLFYRESCQSIRLDLSSLKRSQVAIAVDTKKPYIEITLGSLPAKNQTWSAPYKSDWAVAVGGNVAQRHKGTKKKTR